MITTPKNKNELIDGLKKSTDFAVVSIHTGPVNVISKEVAKHGTKIVSVIITTSK